MLHFNRLTYEVEIVTHNYMRNSGNLAVCGKIGCRGTRVDQQLKAGKITITVRVYGDSFTHWRLGSRGTQLHVLTPRPSYRTTQPYIKY